MHRNTKTKLAVNGDISIACVSGGRDSIEYREPDIATTVRSLMLEYADPARVLELYYWTQEPGLIDVIRTLMALPAQPRATLQSFLLMAPDPKLVRMTIDEFGRLTLFSPQVAKAVAALRDAVTRRD